MSKRNAIVFGLLIFMTGCRIEAQDAVGVWEIRYQDAVGQFFLDVMELRADGTYTTHMQGSAPSDTGQYTIADGVIAFQSALDLRFSNEIPFNLDDNDVLRLTLPAPAGFPPTVVDWRRSFLPRLLDTQIVSGQRVPKDLQLKVRSLTGEARIWRPDAVPTWIRLEAQPNGEFVTTLHFFSAASTEELRTRITAFQATTTTNDGRRTEQQPLPATFIDLLPVLTTSGALEQLGAMENVDLKVWGDYGAVWRLNDGRQVQSVSAETGDLIQGDVTGFIQQYEADWNRAGELWREILANDSEEELLYCFEAKTFDECLAPPKLEKFCFWHDNLSERTRIYNNRQNFCASFL